MIIYGKSACPKCKALNSMFRPLDRLTDAWNEVDCWNCKFHYQHVTPALREAKMIDEDIPITEQWDRENGDQVVGY